MGTYIIPDPGFGPHFARLAVVLLSTNFLRLLLLLLSLCFCFALGLPWALAESVMLYTAVGVLLLFPLILITLASALGPLYTYVLYVPEIALENADCITIAMCCVEFQLAVTGTLYLTISDFLAIIPR